MTSDIGHGTNTQEFWSMVNATSNGQHNCNPKIVVHIEINECKANFATSTVLVHIKARSKDA